MTDTQFFSGLFQEFHINGRQPYRKDFIFIVFNLPGQFLRPLYSLRLHYTILTNRLSITRIKKKRFGTRNAPLLTTAQRLSYHSVSLPSSQGNKEPRLLLEAY